ncbi:MAG TPA: ABC transporter substrate-binding protein [Sporichthya sp.]|nr:ABC transporter substrate-binding protein [Sporichthya sp.]
MRTPLTLTALVVAPALLLAGCGGSGGGGDDVAAVGADGVKTGPGVTADAITLGRLTDASGPFKGLGLNLKAGEDLWLKEVNAAGGVCGRQIGIDSVDHGYKADQATIQFPELEPKVAGMLEVLGSPVIGALKADFAEKKVTSSALAFSSQLLDQPTVLLAGTTYDLEFINALSYLLDEKLIKEGDKIADIYIDGDAGKNGLAGTKYFAEKHNMTVVERGVTATDTDMTNIVTGLRGEGVKAIVMTTSGAQTASVASASAALKLNVPMVANSPSFDPGLLDTPAADALNDKVYVASSSVPYSADLPKAKEIATKFEAAGSGKPSYAVQFGYSLGLVWQQILQKACEAKDLTRDGVLAAKTSSSTVDLQELVAGLDFSKPGSPATREVYIAKVDKSEKGGLKQMKPLAAAPDAMTYKAPFEQ